MSGRSATVAVVGQFGIGNFGNEASLDVGLELVARAGARPVVVTGRPEAVSAARGVKAVPLTAPDAPRGGLRGALGKLADAWHAWRTVGAVDAVLVPGTGILEGLAVRAGEIPLTLFWYALASRARRRPFVVLSVGVDAAESRAARLLFGWTLRCATVLSVRDAQSARAAVGLGLRAAPRVVPDLVLGASTTPGLPEPVCEAQTSRGSPGPVPWARSSPVAPEPVSSSDDVQHRRQRVVAVGVVAPDGIGTRAAWWDPDQYVARTATLVGRLVEGGLSVRVVVGAELDVPTARSVVAAAGAAEVELAHVHDMASLESLLVGCDAVVASRYHNLIAGLRSGVPTVSVGYGDKQRALLDELGSPHLAHDVDGFDPELVAKQVLGLIRDGAEERARIVRFVAGCRERARAQDAVALRVLGPRRP